MVHRGCASILLLETLEGNRGGRNVAGREGVHSQLREFLGITCTVVGLWFRFHLLDSLKSGDYKADAANSHPP